MTRHHTKRFVYVNERIRSLLDCWSEAANSSFWERELTQVSESVRCRSQYNGPAEHLIEYSRWQSGDVNTKEFRLDDDKAFQTAA